MYCASLPATAVAALAVAVVPVAAKSSAFTFTTASLNVTRNLSVSALVSSASAFVPSWRSTDTTVGAVVSADRVTSMAYSPMKSPLVTRAAMVVSPTSSAT